MFSDDEELVDEVPEEIIEEETDEEVVEETEEEVDEVISEESFDSADLESILSEEQVEIERNDQEIIVSVSSNAIDYSESFDSLLESQETIISLLSVSDNEVDNFDSDFQYNNATVGTFLLACILGSFLCFALFRRF